MKLSVVILNWNGEAMMKQFLPILIECSRIEGVELVVADNNSTDNSCQMVENEFPSVRLIRLDQNYGFAEGYNRSLKQLDSEYYLLLNSDVEVTPGWLEPLIGYMDVHPDVAACQPKILNYFKREYFDHAGACGGYIDKNGFPFCRGRILDRVEKDKGQYDSIEEAFWVSGAALFIRKKCYEEVGGMDARFFAHMEEIDMCWRLKWHKYKLVCIPQSTVYHMGGATLNRGNPRKTFLNYRNNLIMLYKNLPDEECKVVLRRRWMWDMIAFWVFVVKLDFRNAGAIIRARREFKHMKPDFAHASMETNRLNFSNVEPQRSDFNLIVQAKLKFRNKYSKLIKHFPIHE